MNKSSHTLTLIGITMLLFISFGSYSQALRISSFTSDQYGGPSEAVSFNGKLFFSAYDPLYGRELWCTDGTAAGTYMIHDIDPGTGSGIGDQWQLTTAVFDGFLYFRGQDTVHGSELWRTDGTSSGTSLFSDLVPGVFSSGVGQLTVVDSLMFFTTYVTSAILWRTNGTTGGTYSVKSFMIATNLAAWNGKLYFSADDNNNGQELWRSNGTTGGTFLLKDLNGAVGASLPCNFHATPSALFFMANTASGWELWKTTGTNNGTQQVVDVNPGPGNGVMNAYGSAAMASIGDTVYFRGRNTAGMYQLFKTDGTAVGTVQLTNHPTGLDDDGFIPVMNGKVYVAGFTDSLWWAWDANTASGGYSNFPVRYQLYTWPQRFLFDEGMYYFCGNDSLFGQEIYKSDGTPGGAVRIQETHLLNNWSPGNQLGFNKIVGKTGNRLVFSLARDRYTAAQALFGWDVTDTVTLYPPVVSVAVPVSAGTMHLIWNRVDAADAYQLRYKSAQDTAWTNVTTTETFRVLNNLDSTLVYMVQFRSLKNAVPSAWSDTSVFDFLYTTNDFDLDMLAERPEDSTSVRLYWMVSSAFSQVQLRYHIFGSTATQTVSGGNGYKKITGLQPGTLYGYTYRVNSGGGWGPWFPGEFYFVTSGNAVSTGLPDAAEQIHSLALYPNPASELLVWPDMGTGKFTYRLMNGQGQLVEGGVLSGSRLRVSQLPAGVYMLLLEGDSRTAVGKFIKE